jgi:hypothetical protein
MFCEDLQGHYVDTQSVSCSGNFPLVTYRTGRIAIRMVSPTRIVNLLNGLEVSEFGDLVRSGLK